MLIFSIFSYFIFLFLNFLSLFVFIFCETARTYRFPVIFAKVQWHPRFLNCLYCRYIISQVCASVLMQPAFHNALFIMEECICMYEYVEIPCDHFQSGGSLSLRFLSYCQVCIVCCFRKLNNLQEKNGAGKHSKSKKDKKKKKKSKKKRSQDSSSDSESSGKLQIMAAWKCFLYSLACILLAERTPKVPSLYKFFFWKKWEKLNYLSK